MGADTTDQLLRVASLATAQLGGVQHILAVYREALRLRREHAVQIFLPEHIERMEGYDCRKLDHAAREAEELLTRVGGRGGAAGGKPDADTQHRMRLILDFLDEYGDLGWHIPNAEKLSFAISASVNLDAIDRRLIIGRRFLSPVIAHIQRFGYTKRMDTKELLADRPPETPAAVSQAAEPAPAPTPRASGPRRVLIRHGNSSVIAEPGTILACPRCDRLFRRPSLLKIIVRLGMHCPFCKARVGRDAIVPEEAPTPTPSIPDQAGPMASGVA